MRIKIIIFLFTFFHFLNSSNAQNLSDTLCFENLFFYGNSITQHGKHIGLSKLRKKTKDIPSLEQHFKNINRIRYAEYPLSITGGIATGLGLGGLLFGRGDDKTISILFLSGGILIFFSEYQLYKLEEQEKKAIVEIYNKSLRN